MNDTDRNEPAQLLTVREACELLRCGNVHLYAIMSRGELPYVKLGRSRRIPLAAVRGLVERNTVGVRQAG